MKPEPTDWDKYYASLRTVQKEADDLEADVSYWSETLKTTAMAIAMVTAAYLLTLLLI